MSSKSEILVLTLGGLVIAACSYLLYADSRMSSENAGGNRRVGSIFYVHNTVQRRHNDSVIWEDARRQTPVYNNNYVRTDEKSEAVVTLEDKTRIDLDPDTMIVLDVSEKKTNIEVRRGSLIIRRAGSGKGLTIRSGESSALVVDGDVRFQRRGNKELVVRPISGRARVGKERSLISSGQSAVLSRKKTRIIRTRFVALSPRDNARFFTTKPALSVNLRWRGKERILLEVSERSDFKNSFLREVVVGGRRLPPLSPGIYFWRAGSASRGEFTVMRGFRVVRLAPIALLAPFNGAKQTFVRQNPLVRFVWEKNALALSYVLEVSRDASFRDIIHKASTLRRNYSLALGEGKYFWRVRSRGAFQGARPASRTRVFRVTRRGAYETPEPARPLDGGSISRELLRGKGELFHWQNDPELNRARLWIASDAHFRRVVFSGEASENFLNLKHDLPPGRYYWRVQGRDEKGKTGPLSRPAAFRVVSSRALVVREPGKKPEKNGRDRTPSGSEPAKTGPGPAVAKKIIKPVRPGAPRLISPRRGVTVDMSTREYIDFRWRAVRGASEYRFRLFRGGKAIYEKSLKSTFFRFTDLSKLDTGRFSWSVKASTSFGGKPLATQAKSVFVITLKEQLKKPELKLK